MINYFCYISMIKNVIFYKIYKPPFKTINTYWNVNGFAKNKKESTMVIAFLPVVTAEENKYLLSEFSYSKRTYYSLHY